MSTPLFTPPELARQLRLAYSPRELCFRTSAGDQGRMLVVTLFTPGIDERTFLLWIGAEDEREPEQVIEAACQAYHQLFLPDCLMDSDWEYDWGDAAPGTTGIWTPHPETGAPEERDALSSVLSVGEPPLGATRGFTGDGRDHRWLYVAKAAGQKPTWPLKRMASLRTELRRVCANPAVWQRVNFQLRHSPELRLRLTGEEPRAAVLVSTTEDDPRPCRLRVDFDTLINWLDRLEAR